MNSPQRAVQEPLRQVATAPRPTTKTPAAGRWFGRWFGGKAAPPAPVLDETEAFLAFPSERGVMPEPPTRPRPAPASVAAPAHGWRPFARPLAIVLGVSFVVVLSVLALRRFPIQRTVGNQPTPAHLTINARPENLEVLIDGESRGTTPLTLSLAPGAHTVIVRSGSEERVVPLTLAAGADVTHYFEMKPLEPATNLGRVSIVTDPPGARVMVDGKAQGASPVTIEDLTATTHKISVTNGAGSAERMVPVQAGGTAAVMFSLPKVAGPVGGWLAIASPFDVEVVERDDIIATSGANKIMLAAGKHDLELSNKRLGYHSTRAVEIAAGKTLTLKVDAPNAAVNVNARPWADVTVDGNSIGQTPIASILMAVGTHELTFKHPQFGERRQTIVVTANGPNRIAVDLTK
jgi:archaellum component FlaG (FlaF/FlaG flagellin family)